MNDQTCVRSVVRAVDLLNALTQGPESLGRLAEMSGLSKATAHRLLTTLIFKQLVIQNPEDGSYLLGPGCFGIVAAVTRDFGVLGIVARPVLERLREDTRETVILHVRVGLQRVCVAELVSPESVHYAAGVGSMAPIHAGSAGKLLLAFSEPEPWEAALTHMELEALTDSTITDRAVLVRELRLIRTRGYAESRGERVVGGAAMSAPVFLRNGEIIAALSVLGPDSRLSDARLHSLRSAFLDAAQEITDRIAALDRIREGVAP